MKIILKKDDVTIIELRHIYSVSKILAKISYGLQRFSNRSFPDFCGFCFCLRQQSLFLLENVFKRGGKIHFHKPPDIPLSQADIHRRKIKPNKIFIPPTTWNRACEAAPGAGQLPKFLTPLPYRKKASAAGNDRYNSHGG